MNQARFDMLEKFMGSYYSFIDDAVYSVKTKRVIPARISGSRRHPYVTLSSKEVHPRPQKYPVHEIVAYLKYGRRIINTTVDHKDNNPLNYSPDNLQLMSLRENARKQGNSYIKLTPDQVREIKILLSQGYTQQAIANKFGVKRPCIEKIHQGKRWKEVII